MLRFDQAQAAALVRTVLAARGVVQCHQIAFHDAAGTALVDFAGPYAGVFRENVLLHIDDSGQLSRALGLLADDVEAACWQAHQELERLEELAAWQAREAAREDQRRHNAAMGVVSVDEAVLDRMPSTSPFAVPEVSAVFLPLPHRRDSGGGSSGSSSADPDRLRVFVSRARSTATDLEAALFRLRSDWAGFVDRCGWVRTGAPEFLTGFALFIEECRADATWIERIASAFEAAGGGTLSVGALDLASTTKADLSERRLLQLLASVPAGELSTMVAGSPELAARIAGLRPELVADWWATLDPQDEESDLSERQGLLLATLPALLGNLEGLPYGARDKANRIALRRGLESVEREIATTQRLVLHTALLPTAPVALPLLMARLDELKERQACLVNIDETLGSAVDGTPRFLLSLTSDQPPLAAVSIGDLDTATNASFVVPGIGTTTQDMSTLATGAQVVQAQRGSGSAVVAWIGYETPPVPFSPASDLSVFGIEDAVKGGAALASALKGFDAVRRESPPELGVVAHSFGSIAASIALTDPDVQADSFTALGSAGLPNWITSASQLHADRVYAGQATDRSLLDPEPGDRYSWAGRSLSLWHRVDPADPAFGARVFGVETGGNAGLPVTTHDLVVGEASADRGYLDAQTESSRNVSRALGGEEENLTPPSPRRQSVPHPRPQDPPEVPEHD
ncbi:hypothetical protein C5E02_08910 [Rathayibacter rathayi]|uniref:DUF1023 domain-containing protein n=1 Tax=Rathayibacter rathayi TaxID=33887 RepID=A0ABX5AEF0_RATRA|nr:alpha/beta hydrolase [Rathayibacter rathayi]AZZ49355.1 hypothetical protein C1O28_09215 [Rathayibacter rathayi]MWV73450.1 hypothetical protein [Rathayibacter rathayi NCPPB 2980 = VKM Ac-1601]PPF50289.1 hypothetical protein C5C08_05430 [Rathayibacter rathayi]PPG69527.1 hypothetical protein C5C16_05720 [Rathayibacter rathayi]PPG80001.1 hypothetical protein C5C15_04375 [Rathayibacter rathayi]